MMHRKKSGPPNTSSRGSFGSGFGAHNCARLWSSTRDAAPRSPASADQNGSDAFGHSTPDGTACAWEWRSISPSDAGFVPDIEARLDRLLADKRAWGLHGVIVARADRLVLERYFEGEDNARGAAARQGRVRSRHAARSVRGFEKHRWLALWYRLTAEAPLLASLPEYSDLGGDPARSHWTIHHALTMRSERTGTKSGTPCANPANSETAIDRAPDRYRLVLDRPILREPGTA